MIDYSKPLENSISEKAVQSTVDAVFLWPEENRIQYIKNLQSIESVDKAESDYIQRVIYLLTQDNNIEEIILVED